MTLQAFLSFAIGGVLVLHGVSKPDVFALLIGAGNLWCAALLIRESRQ